MNRTGTAISSVAVRTRLRLVMGKLLTSSRLHKEFPHGPSRAVPAGGRATRGENSTMCVERCPPYTRVAQSTRNAPDHPTGPKSCPELSQARRGGGIQCGSLGAVGCLLGDVADELGHVCVAQELRDRVRLTGVEPIMV